jgi:amino acid adenylation domain-containing protein
MVKEISHEETRKKEIRWDTHSPSEGLKKLDKKNIEDILALTPMQEGMLFNYLKDPEKDHYFEQLCLDISGEIDVGIFKKAWNFVTQTNEMLRAVFRWEAVENPIQIILKEHKLKLGYYDFTGKNVSERQKRLEKIKANDRKTKFNLQEAPFRIILCKVEKDKYGLIISNHHILYDGWSNGIILKEFFNTYIDLFTGREPIKPVKTKFKEFIKWTQKRDSVGEEKFWRNYLKGFDTQTELSVKRKKREEIISTENFQIRFPKDTKGKLESFVKKYKLTLASLLYSAWGLLLQRYNNSDDVIFGTTVSGRSVKIQGIEEIIGLFINTLPFRVQTDPSEKSEDFLYRMDKSLQMRKEYEATSLVDIKKYSEIDNKEELFDSIFILENYPLDSRLLLEDSKLSIDSYSMFERAPYDLTVGVTIFNDIELILTYNKEVFVECAVVRLANHFRYILEKIVEYPRLEVGRIETVSEGEKKELLYEFNNTEADYPKDRTVHQLFEEQVEKTPDKVAAAYKDKQLTYRGLNKKANQLARRLRLNGVKANSLVGLMPERSIEMIIGIFSILKAGGAYIPLEPEYPEDRIKYMLKECSAEILLANSNRKLLGNISLFINLDSVENPGEDICNLPSLSVPTDLVYVIYTSGTTGRPKGVMIKNKSVTNFIEGITDIIPFTGNDSILSLTTISFDIFGLEFFLPLTHGAKVVIGSSREQLDAATIAAIVEREKITIFQVTPSRLKLIISDKRSSRSLKLLKYLLVGGEIFPEKLLEKTKDVVQGKIFNLYGPTETTIWSCVKDVSGTASLNIGKPIANTQVYILSKIGLVQPLGVPGELCISGAGVASGYFKNELLTEKKFIKNPFIPGEKMYKTGDLAKWLPDGNIEFLGRFDHQVKIRGFRIELGEIESQLLKHEKIKEAVVIPKVDENGDEYLCAYIVGVDTAGIDKMLNTRELRAYLSQTLLDYMIPSYFVQLEEIPLTPSGKTDRKALPAMDETLILRTGAEYVSPRSTIEKTIANIWKVLLHVDKVGIHDHFFDIGGNSLIMIRLSSRLKEAFKRDIPVVSLFNYPTIAALATHLSQEEKGEYVIDVGTDANRNKDMEPWDETKRESVQLEEIMERDEKRRENERLDKWGLEIAIIGMVGRFPGAKNVDEFWNNLKNGVESITFSKKEELLQLGMDSELINDPTYVPAKGILEGKAYFDPAFFGYTPMEAKVMDPQVRIFHECCWEALENAGYNAETYRGRIGVYAGASYNPLWGTLPLNTLGSSASSYVEQWNAVQLSDKDYITTRVGYKLGLRGPCVTMQTACSTSLVAIDQACRGLLSGACDMALAGGVSITLHDEPGYYYQEGGIMSPDGHCRAFDASAKGTVTGNGAGVVVLKPLEDALADRDSIYAVIKGIAINNDGKDKVGFTAPGIEGQASVVRAAHQVAGIVPESIGYIETHGTGTILGDPIEIESLKQAFNTKKSDKTNYCAIGSVKTNIGHLDSAGGVAGFIKTVLILKHGLIPPSLHFESPNPALDLENSPFYVNTELSEWENDVYPLRAGVSAYGIGGTNTHVVLEKAPKIKASDTETGEWREYQLILLSARTPSALECTAQNLANHLKQNPDINLADVAYTLQVGRKTFQCRRGVVCSSVNEAIDELSSPDSKKVKTFRTKEEVPVIFMFPGLGAQYVNMGLELYQKDSVFREEMDRCFDILDSLMDFNIKEILYPSTAPSSDSQLPASSEEMNQIEISQILIFILEYSLARLLMKWGIKPEAMIGYSFGEYTAACIAGVFSLENALKLVVSRGQLIKKLPVGIMLSVPLSVAELTPLLNDELSLAIDNGPSCIVAGPPHAVDALEKQLKSKKYLCMRVQTSHAIHSKMMEPILKEFEDHVSALKLNKPRIPYISNVTGKWMTPQEAVNPHYWVVHMRKTVQFAEGITELVKTEKAVFVEVGPGRDLTTMIARHISNDSKQQAVNMVRNPQKDTSDVYFLLERMARLWLWGVKIDWEPFHSREKRCRIPLPTYPFERQRYWFKGLIPFKGGENVFEGDSRIYRKPDMADWFYIPSWKRAIRPPGHSMDTSTPSTWLLFIDDTGLGAQLAKRLEKRGQVVTVRLGAGFQKQGDSEFTINPQKEHGNGYDALFDEIIRLEQIPDKIVHLWSITANHQNHNQLDIQWVDKIQDLGFYSLLSIAQVIGKKHLDHHMEITVVTNNMHSVTSGDGWSPEKSTVLGPVKIIPLEYSNIRCRSIDIGLSEPGHVQREQLLDQLLEELTVEIWEPIVAFYSHRWWVPIFETMQLEESQKKSSILRQEGVYLITGGLGGIGLYLAEYLAKTVCAKLVLTGRSAFPPEDQWEEWLSTKNKNDVVTQKIRKMKELKKAGAEVLVFSADVTDGQQMQEVAAQALEAFGRINGVLHCAGLPDGEVIQRRTRETTEQILAAKVRGTLVLDRVLKGIPLDFFVFCSSTASILGGIGQVGYCAANNFLDAFAHYKGSNDNNGIFSISINWERWQNVGIAAIAEEVHKQLTGGDLQGGFTAGEGMEAFGRILGYPLPQVVVSSRDFEMMIEESNKPTSYMDEIRKVEEVRDAEDLQQRPALETEYAAPGNKIEQILADIWAGFFGFEQVGIHDDFFELGGDSLKAMVVTAKIHKKLNVEIPIQEFFNLPTIKELARYVTHHGERIVCASIEPTEEKEYYELSSAQKRLYVLQQMSGNSTTYNETVAVGIEGDLQTDQLEEVFKGLIKRHEMLRTSFDKIGGEPVQRVHEEVEFGIEYYEVSRGQKAVGNGEEQYKSDYIGAPSWILSEADKIIKQQFIRSFDLSCAPLLRVGLIKVKETGPLHILIMDMPHIVADGTSDAILLREFVALYDGRELPPLGIQYRDYLEWQKSESRKEAIKRQEDFWLKEFSGEIPVLHLPTDFPRPKVQDFKGKRVGFVIEKEETLRLKELASKEEVTLFMILLAIFNILLLKLSGQKDIVVGTGVEGRRHEDLRNVIGMFVNTLPLRNSPAGEKIFREFLSEVKERTLAVFDNQDYPFEDMVDKLKLNRDMSRNPLFDVIFQLDPVEIPEIEAANLQVKPYNCEIEVSKFDLRLQVFEIEDSLFFRVEYFTRLFKKETIERFTTYFKEIVSYVLKNNDAKLKNISISHDLHDGKSAFKVEDYSDFKF